MEELNERRRALLIHIGDRLRNLEAAIVGAVTMDGDRLLVQDGGLLLEAFFPPPEADANPALVHAHVTARFQDDFDKPLSSCIVAVSGNADDPLAGVADRWLVLAAPPLLSWLNKRAVLGAQAFHGNESWGVPGGEGFAGPLSMTLVSPPEEASPSPQKGGEDVVDYLQSQPLYLNARELAADAGTHIAKVTFGNLSGGWRRSLELDDHAAAIENFPWPPAPPGVPEAEAAPTFSQALLAGFAIFSPTSRPEPRPCGKVDAALVKMMEHFATHGVDDSDLGEETMLKAGVEAALAADMARFVGIAFGRVMTAHLGVAYSDAYCRLRADGVMETRQLSGECVYLRAFALAPGLMFSPRYTETFQKLALFSPELNALNQALWNNSDPKDLHVTPPLFPDADVPEKVLRQALEKLGAGSPGAGKKKWWQFWK